MIEPRIEVWITKYALTRGIIRAEARVCVHIDDSMIHVDGARG
jgi:hypothetical protein